VQSELREASPLELRLGFEVTPFRELLHEDLGRYALEGVDAVLFDTPFIGPLDLLFALAERAREQGLRPIAAHPERAEAVLLDSTLLDELAQRALLIQVNASSLTGRHGPEIEDVGWRALERGLADLVASDGHGPTRPARLDDAFEAARRRVGEGAVRLFDGSALALRSEPVRPAEASHAA
jgi:tyrosine-protein phosphatase YwqE